jgi:hypothetical protein
VAAARRAPVVLIAVLHSLAIPRAARLASASAVRPYPRLVAVPRRVGPTAATVAAWTACGGGGDIASRGSLGGQGRVADRVDGRDGFAGRVGATGISRAALANRSVTADWHRRVGQADIVMADRAAAASEQDREDRNAQRHGRPKLPESGVPRSTFADTLADFPAE